MDKSTQTTPENPTHSPESLHQQQKGERVSNLPKQTFENTSSKAAEYIDLGESAEIQGEVSEVMKEQSERKGDGATGGKGGGKYANLTPAQIRAKLLAEAPSQEVMFKQIKKEIEKEIKYLNKRATRIIRRPGSMNAFELNNIVKKIRDLKTLLLALAKATIDMVKTLWLRFVHGVM
ncbi:MAG: hypothetical protein WC604_00345 [Candidatus Gracilibacteria bacterium]